MLHDAELTAWICAAVVLGVVNLGFYNRYSFKGLEAGIIFLPLFNYF